MIQRELLPSMPLAQQIEGHQGSTGTCLCPLRHIPAAYYWPRRIFAHIAVALLSLSAKLGSLSIKM